MAEITPRERVWQSIRHIQTDRVPWHFPCTIPTRIKLEKYYGTTDLSAALDQNMVKFSGRANQPPVEIRPGIFRDEFGVVWNRTVDKDIGAVEEFLLKDRSLKSVKFPNPHDPNRMAAMLVFSQAHPNRFRLFSLSFSLFERAWILRGMEDLMCHDAQKRQKAFLKIRPILHGLRKVYHDRQLAFLLADKLRQVFMPDYSTDICVDVLMAECDKI